jgi:hypothetical protein
MTAGKPDVSIVFRAASDEVVDWFWVSEQNRDLTMKVWALVAEYGELEVGTAMAIAVAYQHRLRRRAPTPPAEEGR